MFHLESPANSPKFVPAWADSKLSIAGGFLQDEILFANGDVRFLPMQAKKPQFAANFVAPRKKQ